MLLNAELEKMMNQQYTNEVSSALLYKNIAGFYDDKYFGGFAKFFQKKYQEELGHAQRFYNYINGRDGRAILSEIPKDQLVFDEKSLVSPFYDSLKHEQQVSTWIYELMTKSRELKDYTSEEFLYWFVKEQAEEEQEFLDYIARLELIKNSGEGMYRFNDYLSEKYNNLIEGI